MAPAQADEFDTLRLRWRDMLTQGTNSSLGDPLYSTWIDSIGSSAQSYWNTLNTAPNRTYLWSTYQNLATDSSDITGSYSRLRTMALACSVRGSALENNSSLRAAVISGLDWLYTNHYNEAKVVFDNWFDFEIASPLALNDATVLLYSNLSPAQISNYMNAIDHFTPAPDLTAANKVWKSLAVTLRGVIIKDSAKLALGRDALSDVFPCVTTNDGFYADGSFIFHNYFAYNGGYGVELLDSMGMLMQLLSASSWQVTDPAQTNVFKWVYDSYEPFIVRGASMEMVQGRYYTRTGDAHARGHDMLGAILRIAQVAPPADGAAYKAFVKGAIQADTARNFIANEPPPYNVWANTVVNDTNIVSSTFDVRPSNLKMFPGMDRIVHRTPNWTFGIAMSSSRVANYESTRGENLRGWFTGEGMTYLYNDDLTQYSDNFWPTVNPYRLPGTTVDVATRTNGSGDTYRSPYNHVGGASILGLYGVAVMHLNAWNSTLSARKSWFLFDNEIVCLGTSVSSTDGRAAQTIVENRKLGLYGDNAFTVGTSNFEIRTLPSGPGWSESMTNTCWAHLAGTTVGADIGYYFPNGGGASYPTVQALRESRSGALYDLNTNYGTTNRSTRHYLTMWFDHGINPTNGTYAYALLPNQTAAQVAAYAASPDITVVENTSRAQAVKENKLGITAVNFWRDGSNYVAGVSSDRKASVILLNDGRVLDIGIADPTQTNAGLITVEVNTAADPDPTGYTADAGLTVLQLTPTLKLAANVSNKLGATLRARFPVAPVQTNTLSPMADAYVQNGGEADNNFGAAVTLGVKSSGANNSRETYLRFDLSSLTGPILGATLRLLPVTVNEPLTHALAVVADNSWGESTITWNNKPAFGPEYARWTLGPVGTPVTVPVTPLVQQALSADHQLSFSVFSTNTTPATNGGFIAYASKENGTAANRPQLSVSFVRSAPTVTLSVSGQWSVASGQGGATDNGPRTTDAPATVTLNATAQDADGYICCVEFLKGTGADATPLHLDYALTAPYTITVPNLAADNYTFTAVAIDNAGLMTTSAPVVVTVCAPEPPGRGTGLNAEYYTDQNLTAFALSRIDTNVNFSWGFNSPAPGPVPADHFSVRWTGKLQARHAGLHQFHTVTDEGVRLWIDGRLLIDNWTPHLQAEDTGSLSLMAGRYYDITMEYFDTSASASARLYWTQPGVEKEIIPQAQLYPADQGLRATYFSGTNLSAGVPVLTRIDDCVNFNWGTNSPDPTALPGAFSARWTGKVRANQSGTYSFFTWSDDAVRLWVNGQLIISNWTAHPLSEDSNTIALAAGQFYDVTLEYFNSAGTATAVLSWQPPGGPKQVIPAGNLTPYGNNNPPSLWPMADQVGARRGLFTFTAGANDPDAPGQSLTFSLDPGAPIGATVHPSSGVFTWTPSNTQPYGPYTLTLRVSDNGSPVMTDAQTFTLTVLSNLIATTATLVPTNALWRYLDTGVDPGTAWHSPAFNPDASGWKTGAAPLGYGLGDERTVLDFGPNASNKYVTTYFRRAFFIPDASLVQSLNARLARDDGAVVFLNDVEVWRDNMPSNAVNFSTLAQTTISGTNQTQFILRALGPSALVNGLNILAVELHQDSPATPDARFDFELTATALVPEVAQISSVPSGNSTLLTWPQSAGLLRVYATTNLSPTAVWSALDITPVFANGQCAVQLSSTTNKTQFFRLQSP